MEQLFEIPNPRSVRRTAKLDCQVVRLRDFRLVADRIENLSPDGILVGPADPVMTGEPVIVSFRMPGLKDYIDLEAVVARVVHGRRPGESSRELGLSITQIGGFSRTLLGAYVRSLPPIPPRFRRGVFRGVPYRIPTRLSA
jgi:PilZ domain